MFKYLNRFILVILSFVVVGCGQSRDSSDQNYKQTLAYFNQIKTDPPRLALFVGSMPKGADLHNHLSGAVYAEDTIHFAANDGFCVDSNLALTKNSHCASDHQLKNLSQNYALYSQLINYWSVRQFARAIPDTRLDFFDSFLRDLPALNPHRGEIIANLMQRNAAEHVDYVELLTFPRTDESIPLGLRVPDLSFEQMRDFVLQHGGPEIVEHMQMDLTHWLETKNTLLHCNTPQAEPGCQVVPKFQFIAYRGLPNPAVFTQLLLGFMLANQDHEVVGVNIVGPEDAPMILENYEVQMQMFAYLHQLYPKVKYSLHAGELTPGLVRPEDLLHHINQAIFIAHANRIGHGSDIPYEQDASSLLAYMAKQHIPVEIALTSNDYLLNLKGVHHPLSLYLHYHVPVTLSTDDEGVFRTSLNQEYLRAVSEQHIDYPTLKQFARNGLTYAFIEGDSIWVDPDKLKVTGVCTSDELGSLHPSIDCEKFLKASPKATLQWQLETEFKMFESKIAVGAIHESPFIN